MGVEARVGRDRYGKKSIRARTNTGIVASIRFEGPVGARSGRRTRVFLVGLTHSVYLTSVGPRRTRGRSLCLGEDGPRGEVPESLDPVAVSRFQVSGW